jgi:dihydrofolate reductase
MCTTIDGKILSKRWGKLPGPKSSASLFETTAASFNIPAWIVGTTTMKEFAAKPRPLKRAAHPVPAGDFLAAGNAKSFAIGVDAKAVLRFDNSESDGDHIVILTTKRASAAYLAHLREAGVSYLLCGKQTLDLPLAMRKLSRDLNIKKLMLEGGGKFNGSMLRAGLVDQISQIIVPIVDGGMGISSFFEIPGPPPPAAAAHLQLMSHRTLPGGVLWLRYRVK